jgi:hypothetical protein
MTNSYFTIRYLPMTIRESRWRVLLQAAVSKRDEAPKHAVSVVKGLIDFKVK